MMRIQYMGVQSGFWILNLDGLTILMVENIKKIDTYLYERCFLEASTL